MALHTRIGITRSFAAAGLLLSVTLADFGCKAVDDFLEVEETKKESEPNTEEEEEASSEGVEEEGTEDDESDSDLSPLPSPKACERYAPQVAFEDTNPNSSSFKKKLAPKDYKGNVVLWIPTFDCNC